MEKFVLASIKLNLYTFSLKTTSIKLENNGDDIRLYLKPKMPLISAEEPLPPRGDMHQYHKC
jgi:hypothetical protein